MFDLFRSSFGKLLRSTTHFSEQFDQISNFVSSKNAKCSDGVGSLRDLVAVEKVFLCEKVLS